MKRADRLMNLLQMLRRHRRPVTAEHLSQELEVSVRTIYRDMAGLVANRVPIRGEAGMGYVLEAGFDLPPMMFSVDEVEALLIGMRWLRGRGDATLVKAADDVIAKIGAVLPKSMQPLLYEGGLFAPNFSTHEVNDTVDVGQIRMAIRKGRKLRLNYADANGEVSERTIWPFGLSYFEFTRMIMAWCELRQGFRHFRTDRILRLEFCDEPYPVRRSELLRRWEAEEKPKYRDQTSAAATLASASG
jgi:predicted DNA-binding transcriptional regulator YafY